jgi:hypothetical protein
MNATGEVQGEISGRSTTIFTSAFDEAAGGTYVALESFEGSLRGAAGTFNFVHSASTSRPDGRVLSHRRGQRHGRAHLDHRDRRPVHQRGRHPPDVVRLRAELDSQV